MPRSHDTVQAMQPATLHASDAQLCLPIWPSHQRGLPNAFARSALFAVGNRRDARQFLKDAPIAAVNGITITYRGEELRQDDEDVFLQLLHLARGQDVQTVVGFTAGAMLRELGWTRNSASMDRLVECINRMVASSISVTVSDHNGIRENFTGSLIRAFRWREDATGRNLRRWTILLEPEIVSLFSPRAFSRVDWHIRLKLPPLAKWLHSFYHSHAEPYPYRVETIKALTGSRIGTLYQFRYKLKEALAQLVEHGFLAEATICPRTDLVMVKRRQQHVALAA